MEIKGDFLGFEFNGIRSEDLGVVRVSNNDRYTEDLQPDIKDIAAEVPGMDGQYFFGSNFDTKKITMSIAFDELTEEQLRKLRKTFGSKSQGELIFDELPYKKYIAKLESPIQLSYVCFDRAKLIGTESGQGVRVIDRTNGIVREDIVRNIYDNSKTERIYKGEGEINFVCYFPFAKSCFKVLSVGEEESDWAISSGLLTQALYNNVDKYISNTGKINIYNPGDIPTGFRLYFPSGAAGRNISLSYKSNPDATSKELNINAIELKSGDEGFIIDTNSELILGVKDFEIDQSGEISYSATGNIYNQYVESGYFFKFDTNSSIDDNAQLTITGGIDGIEIFYDYLYF